MQRERKWKNEKKRKEKHSSQGSKPGRAALAKVRAQKERLNTWVYLNPELRKAWFPCLGYIGNFILKSSHKHFQIDCVHAMVLVIFVFSVSESLVVFVALRTAYNALRCHSNKGQLSVAIQCTAVSFKQGATFRCHSMRCGAIQTRGNFPLPFRTPQCHFKQGATFRCHAVSFRQGAIFHCHGSEVAHLKSRFGARWAVVVCKNSFWEFLLRLTNLLERYSIF